jgi:hypothetical protein
MSNPLFEDLKRVPNHIRRLYAVALYKSLNAAKSKPCDKAIAFAIQMDDLSLSRCLTELREHSKSVANVQIHTNEIKANRVLARSLARLVVEHFVDPQQMHTLHYDYSLPPIAKDPMMILKDLAINEPAPTVSISPISRTVSSLTKAIWVNGDFEAIPVLADACEEDGLDQQIVDHFRSTNQHFHGCWALEILRKM